MVQKNYRNAGKTYDERLQNAFTAYLLRAARNEQRRCSFLHRRAQNTLPSPKVKQFTLTHFQFLLCITRPKTIGLPGWKLSDPAAPKGASVLPNAQDWASAPGFCLFADVRLQR